jgi:integrase
MESVFLPNEKWLRRPNRLSKNSAQIEMPAGDKWILTDTYSKSPVCVNRKFKLSFSFITQPQIKAFIKEFIWEETQTKKFTLSTASRHLIAFKTFEQFFKNQGYTTLLISSTDVELYKSYLITLLGKYGKPLSPQQIKQKLTTLRVIISFGKKKKLYHLVPENDILWNSTEYFDATCLNQMPLSDKWIITDTYSKSPKWFNSKFKLNFSFITPPLIKDLVKKFIWEETRKKNITLLTSSRHLIAFKTFQHFGEIQGYTTLLLSYKDIKLYQSYLTSLVGQKGKPLSPEQIKEKLTTLKVIIQFGQQKELFHLVPRNNIFSNSNEYHYATYLDHMPDSDKWIITDCDHNSQYYRKEFKFDFSFISQPLIKHLVKKYIWEETCERNIVLSTAAKTLSDFKVFEKFSKIQGLSTLLLSNTHIELYKSYLANLLDKKGKPFTRLTQKHRFTALKVIIRFGQQKEMYHVVPRTEIFSGSEYRGIAKNLAIDYIPDNVVTQISTALIKEKNTYIRSGLRILQGTGMRIGDMLLLKVDCLSKHPIDKSPIIKIFQHKSRKNLSLKLPDFVVQGIKELLEYTASIREQAPEEVKDYLFIYQRERNGGLGRNKGTIGRVPASLIRYWFAEFCSNYSIRGNDGQIYPLSPHQLRRSLGTDMLSNGIPLKAVANQLGVVPKTAEKYYVTVKDSKLAATFSGIVIGNIENVDEKFIPNPDELEWFYTNKHKGALMCDGYCTKPFKNNEEICERLKNKWACYKCNRYITTLAHLEFHKNILTEIENELKYNPYGDHYAAHLIPIAIIIKQIVDRLEDLKNEKSKEHK